MGGLILGVNTLYRVFCFFKLFTLDGKGLSDLIHPLSSSDEENTFTILVLKTLVGFINSLHELSTKLHAGFVSASCTHGIHGRVGLVYTWDTRPCRHLHGTHPEHNLLVVNGELFV